MGLRPKYNILGLGIVLLKQLVALSQIHFFFFFFCDNLCATNLLSFGKKI